MKADFTPRDHQSDAFNFALNNNGLAIFAHDVGTGKTPATLMVYDHYKKQEKDLKMMVFCPVNLINKTWGKNIKNFTDYNYYDCREDKAYYFNGSRDIDIFVLNYEGMIRERHIKRLEVLLQKHPFMGVLDESHRIKDRTTSSCRVVNGYNKGRRKIKGLREYMKYRLCLSGTPAPNSEIEWFSQIDFLSPEIFNMKFVGFRNYFFYMKRTAWNGTTDIIEVPSNILDVVSKGYRLALNPNRSKEFYEILSKYVHYVKEDECQDLPEVSNIYRYVTMTDKQKSFYRDMERDMCIELSEEEEVTANIALTKIGKLNQISNGFVYNDQGNTIRCSNKKLDEMKTILEELGSKQVVIWGRFAEEIEAILEMLGDKATHIYGKTKDPQQSYQDYIDGKYQYLVAHPKSASEGLDMLNGHYEIFSSIDHSIREYTQCKGRIRRDGQKENKCFYIHIITEGTIEEEILLVLEGKKTVEQMTYEFVKRIQSSNKRNKLVKKMVS